jgi:hypothetical protein
MNTTDLLARKIIDFYATNDSSQIAHTQCVVSYTHLIASAEGWPVREAMVLECAAWMHDIGCPAAVKKYGNSKPEHQMSEGRLIVPAFLDGFNGLTATEKQWIADVVGTHHQMKWALSLHYEPLFEADLIVNLLEGYYPMSQAENYLSLVHTAEGLRIFKALTHV